MATNKDKIAKANPKAAKNKYQVTKPNPIAEARGTINKGFLDILDIALYEAVLDLDNPLNLKYEISASKYCDKFGLKFDRNAYAKLQSITERSYQDNGFRAYLRITDKNGNPEDFVVFQSIKYHQDKQTITVMFSETFKELMINLFNEKGRKVYYSLPDTLRMNSEYSKKLYPILLERICKTEDSRMTFSAYGTLRGERYDSIFPIDDFVSQLGIPKSYKTSNIKDTCNLIIAEIEAYTPYHAEVYYNVARAGRGRPKTTHVCFRMTKKYSGKVLDEPIDVKASEEPEIKEDSNIDLCVKAVTSAAKEAKIKLTDENIADIAKDASKTGLSENDIRERILYIRQHAGRVENPVGYLRYAMSDKYQKPKEAYFTSRNMINREDDYDIDELVKQRTIEKMSDGKIDSSDIDKFLADLKEKAAEHKEED